MNLVMTRQNIESSPLGGLPKGGQSICLITPNWQPIRKKVACDHPRSLCNCTCVSLSSRQYGSCFGFLAFPTATMAQASGQSLKKSQVVYIQ
jgi:hypothetical protein